MALELTAPTSYVAHDGSTWNLGFDPQTGQIVAHSMSDPYPANPVQAPKAEDVIRQIEERMARNEIKKKLYIAAGGLLVSLIGLIWAMNTEKGSTSRKAATVVAILPALIVTGSVGYSIWKTRRELAALPSSTSPAAGSPPPNPLEQAKDALTKLATNPAAATAAPSQPTAVSGARKARKR